ncbi:MAG: peptidoglycan DD-metalloendopeptidase family protein [Myxococcota bacterium]
MWVLLGVWLAFPGLARSDSTDPELQQLRAAIALSRERVVDHERQARDIVQLLEDVDRGLDALDVQVAESESGLEEAESRLASSNQQLRVVQARTSETQRAMSRRAVALYKSGAEGPLRLLFASQNLREMFSKLWSLERILQSDVILLARFQTESVELEAILDRTARARSELQAAQIHLTSRRSALASEREERRKLLEEVRASRTRERALLRGLEQAAIALEETLVGMQGSRRFDAPDVAPSQGFMSRKGELSAPVKGRIRRPFGRVVDAQYQTAIFRKGVEFSAPVGDAVRAVAAGRIRFAGWFRGYGKIVIIDHGEGYFTVSGHLSQIRVQVGEPVHLGELLGTVGETGSLDGPGLYFEVRRGGVPLDPAEWLAKG